MFNLEKYVEKLCWEAYLKNEGDRTLELQDFRQEAQLALASARGCHVPSRGRWTTYAVSCVNNSLHKLVRNRIMIGGEPDLATDPPDFFMTDVDSIARGPLTPRARRLLKAALRSDRLSRCSLHALRRSLEMTRREFSGARQELREKMCRIAVAEL